MRCSNINKSWRLRFALLFLVSLSLCSCMGYHVKSSQPKGVYHRVKSGDTLWNIARAYRVNIQDLAEINNITDPNLIEEGSVVFIPSANYIIDDVMPPEVKMSPAANLSKEETDEVKIPPKPKRALSKDSSKDEQKEPQRTVSSEKESSSIPAKRDVKRVPVVKDHEDASGMSGKGVVKKDAEQKDVRVKQKDGGGELEKIKFDRDRFVWPVKGKVRSKFGIQPNGMYYNWIRISANDGASVHAAAGGIVIFSASLKDYGETIIIKHEDNYATVYTHLNNRMVKVDDQVKKGGRIAFLGQSDKRSEAYMHFEVRYKNKSRNPLFFLP